MKSKLIALGALLALSSPGVKTELNTVAEASKGTEYEISADTVAQLQAAIDQMPANLKMVQEEIFTQEEWDAFWVELNNFESWHYIDECPEIMYN